MCQHTCHHFLCPHFLVVEPSSPLGSSTPWKVTMKLSSLHLGRVHPTRIGALSNLQHEHLDEPLPPWTCLAQLHHYLMKSMSRSQFKALLVTRRVVLPPISSTWVRDEKVMYHIVCMFDMLGLCSLPALSLPLSGQSFCKCPIDIPTLARFRSQLTVNP
jgi:hypothetical protein